MNRRTFAGLAAAAAAVGAPADAVAKPLPICAFSKHFQWTTVAEAAKLCADLGYDGMDLTVRDGGHVLPERVSQDLPKAVEAIKAAGLEAPMFTAGIVETTSPHAEAILKTASSLGIRRYRWGGFRYNTAKPIPAQIAELTAKSKALADLNRRHGMCAMYHTHSGVAQFGASFWDIWMVLKDLDPNQVSVNFDIGHATVEGGDGGWMNSSRLILPMARGIAVKDFRWEKNAQGRWVPRWCALGEGMVNIREFLGLVKAAGFRGPIQLHMEYPELGGANDGKTTMTISRDEFLRLARRDMQKLRSLMKESGLG